MNAVFRIAAVAAVIAAAGAVTRADTAGIEIRNGWIRALPNGLPAGGYFTLYNDTGGPLRLVGASSPACGLLMLHRTETMNGIAQMNDVPAVDVPPHGTLVFAPGGYHLMCMGPTPALAPGNVVPVTLQFSDGARLTARFAVRNAAGR